MSIFVVFFIVFVVALNSIVLTTNPIFHWIYYISQGLLNICLLTAIVATCRTFFEWPRRTISFIMEGRPSSSGTAGSKTNASRSKTKTRSKN